MTKEQAIALVQELTEATVRHYRSVNENTKFSATRAMTREYRAGETVLAALTSEPLNDGDIEAALNW